MVFCSGTYCGTDLGVEQEDLQAEADLANEAKKPKVEEIHDVDADDGRKSKKQKTSDKAPKKEESDEEDDDEDEEESSEDEKDTSVLVKEEADDEDDVPVAKSNGKHNPTIIKDEDDEEMKTEMKDESDEEDEKEKKSKKNKNKKRKNQAVKDSEYSVARGVDFKGVQTVVNFDFPKSTKAYIHRIGRTARAGTKGLAVSLVSPGDDEEFLNNVVKKRNKHIPEFGFQLKSIESFRYRCEDVLAGITPNHVCLCLYYIHIFTQMIFFYI